MYLQANTQKENSGINIYNFLDILNIFVIFFLVVFTSQFDCTGASLIPQLVKNPPAMQETLVPSLGREDLLEKG